eukprot:s894_g25.t1
MENGIREEVLEIGDRGFGDVRGKSMLMPMLGPQRVDEFAQPWCWDGREAIHTGPSAEALGHHTGEFPFRRKDLVEERACTNGLEWRRQKRGQQGSRKDPVRLGWVEAGGPIRLPMLARALGRFTGGPSQHSRLVVAQGIQNRLVFEEKNFEGWVEAGNVVCEDLEEPLSEEMADGYGTVLEYCKATDGIGHREASFMRAEELGGLKAGCLRTKVVDQALHFEAKSGRTDLLRAGVNLWRRGPLQIAVHSWPRVASVAVTVLIRGIDAVPGLGLVVSLNKIYTTPMFFSLRSS